jgi:hypothetical protein
MVIGDHAVLTLLVPRTDAALSRSRRPCRFSRSRRRFSLSRYLRQAIGIYPAHTAT